MRLSMRLCLTFLVLALVAAACGGEGGETQGSDAADAAATPGDSDTDAADGTATEAGDAATEAAAGDAEAELVFFDASGNETLDPAHAQNNSSLSQEALMGIYDRLVHFSPEGDPIPGLAESWEYNDDLTEFTLHLREGVTFHDGTAFDADAVIANFDRYSSLDSDVGATVQNTFELIESYEATDDMTVTLTLTEPSGQMPYWLASQGGMMVSPAVLEGDPFGVDLEPIGAGPYRVTNFESNVVTEMERFEDYWDTTEGRPARFEHHYVTDGQARLNAVRSGEANLSILDANQIPEAESAGLEVQVNPQQSLWHIYTNLSGVFSDINVRKAFMHAIDRQALVDALTYGSGEPAWQIFPEESPVYLEELHESYEFDPERARELLAEAGHEDGVELHFILLNNTEYSQLAEALQQMVAESGFTLNFETVDISQAVVFRGDDPRGDMMMARWGGRADPLMTFQEVYWSEGTYTPGGTASERVDQLVEEAMALPPDDPERLDLLHELNREVTEQAAAFPIMIRSNVFAYPEGCISGLPPYLATGDDLMNHVQVAADC